MVTHYAQGDVVVVSFDPSVGSEPAKTRPALVVSSDKFNRMSSMTMVAPIASTSNGYPLHVELSDTDPEVARGYVCVEQTRAMNLSARRCRRVGSAGVVDMREVMNLLGAVFDL